MKTKFTIARVLQARLYWAELTYKDLFEFWKHYTVGSGKGMYCEVKPDTSFADYLVYSAEQSACEKYFGV